jgi:hypothetical protein
LFVLQYDTNSHDCVKLEETGTNHLFGAFLVAHNRGSLMSQRVAEGPGRTGYWIAAVIFVLGLVATGALVFLFLTGILGIGDDLNRFVAPGTEEVELSDTGRYVLFYERESQVGGTSYSTDQSPPHIDVQILRVADGEEIQIERARGQTTYDFQDYSGVSVREFRIEQPGSYEISVDYAGESENGEFVLAYGQGVERGILTSVGSFFAAGFAFCFFTVISIAVAGITFFRRLQSQRPQET